MTIRKSHIVFLSCILFICLALFGRIGERRLAADRDGWVQRDSTLTAHTMYCDYDPIQLECPPPRVKWHELDFTDPETGESIFADLGLKPVYQDGFSTYDCPEMIINNEQVENYYDYSRIPFSSNGIGMTARFFIPDTVERIKEQYDFGIAVQIFKYLDLAPLYSQKHIWTRYRQRKEERGEELPARWGRFVWEHTEGLAYYKTAAGHYEKSVLDAYTGPDEPLPEGRWYFGAKWSKGLWKTNVMIYGYVNNSLQQTYEFQEEVTARIMDYYRDLNRHYAMEGS